jgi:hypothetical protein
MATQQPGDKQIRQMLDSSITGLDAHRTEGLQQNLLLQTNKDRALKKEQARLQKKYGADHPRVAKISNRLAYNQAAVPDMKREFKQSMIDVPEFDTNTWMVHGRVLNQKLTGIKDLTLALYTADGKVDKRLEFACTDERGYYAIRYRVNEGEKPLINPKTDYFLAVSDGEGKVCYRDDDPLHVVIGQTDYRLIVLDGAKCTPPPGWDEGDDGGDDDGGDVVTGEWTVTGTVKHANGKPGIRLVANLLDKKEKKNIGTAKTDDTGGFKLIFSTEKDPALFKTKPDLFLVVTDTNNKQLYVADKPLKPVVGGVEKLKIVLKT